MQDTSWKKKNFPPDTKDKMFNGRVGDEQINLSYSKYTKLLMVESRLRDIWALAQNSFNYMFENIQ